MQPSAQSRLPAAVNEAARRLTRYYEKHGDDPKLLAVYCFAGPGKASVVWIDRLSDGSWQVRQRGNPGEEHE